MDLKAKNVEAVKQALDDMDRRIRELHQRVDGIHNLLSAVLQKQLDAEQGERMRKVLQQGTGPSVT